MRRSTTKESGYIQDRSQGRGVLSDHDTNVIRKKMDDVKHSHWRGPWAGGGTQLFALMKPGEDPIEDKLFNLVSSLNIYAGLIVSGLIGYVLEPQDEMEGMCELTGTTRQEVHSWQTLLAHLNLTCGAIMFAFTTYMAIFATLETPQTITRCVSKATGLWVYLIMTFFQMFLLIAQSCVAAILNLDAEWAKVVIAVDVGLCIALVLFSEHLIGGPNGMFPLGMFDWLICCPGVLLHYLYIGRDVPSRIGETLVADAGHLQLEEEEEAERKEEEHEQAKELKQFICLAIRSRKHWDDERLDLVVDAMLREGLTVETMRSMSSIPSGALILFNSLQLELVELKRGERMELVAAAMNHQEPTLVESTGVQGGALNAKVPAPVPDGPRELFPLIPNQVA